MTDKASLRSVLIAGPEAVAFAAVEPFPAVRSGFAEPRRADRFCCASMIAGNESATARNKMPGTKNLFLTRPPKTVVLLARVFERQFRLPGSEAKRGRQDNMKQRSF